MQTSVSEVDQSRRDTIHQIAHLTSAEDHMLSKHLLEPTESVGLFVSVLCYNMSFLFSKDRYGRCRYIKARQNKYSRTVPILYRAAS